jgi:hypothetical protein
MNDGDWVESCTALVEHHSGQWEIITWTKEKDNVDTDNTSNARKRSEGHSGQGDPSISESDRLRTSKKNNDQLVEV